MIKSSRVALLRTIQRFCNFSTAPRLFNENLNVLYDSKCSLCNVEIKFLRERDGSVNSSPRLRFTDVEDLGYDENAKENGGVTYEEAMARISAISYTGEKLYGVQAIRAAYGEVKLGWLYSFLNLPLAGKAADFVYDIWAKERTFWTRGERLETIFAKRKVQRGEEDSSSCTCVRAK